MEAILPLALLAAAFYLLVMRPMSLRSRRAADLKENLKPGVEVITSAGMFGRVERVCDDEVFLEIAPGVVIKLVSAAVGKILTPDPDPDPDPEAGAGTVPDAVSGEDPKPPKTL